MRKVARNRSRTTARNRREAISPQIQEAVADVHALCEALEGGAALEQVATVRTCRIDMPLPELSAEDVRSIRESLGLSQALFAEFLGVGLPTVRSWEQGQRAPSALARRFLGEIRDDPPFWRKKLARATVRRKPARTPR